MTAIYNESGNKVGEYAYDAWGNCTVLSGAATDVVRYNPIRYRGYYYDEDMKLYYLNSRYYCPEWRRFISPDSIDYLDPESVNGLNLYAYCNNDPVNYVDPSGAAPIAILILTGLFVGLGVGVGLSYAAYTDRQDDNEINGSVGWKPYLGGAMIGGAVAFGAAYFGPQLISLLLSVFGTSGTAGTLALAGGGEIVVSVAGVLSTLAASLGLMLFAKGGLPNNQYQNKQWREAMRRLGIEDKDLQRRLHDEVHKHPYQRKLKDLLDLLRKILQKWGK